MLACQIHGLLEDSTGRVRLSAADILSRNARKSFDALVERGDISTVFVPEVFPQELVSMGYPRTL